MYWTIRNLFQYLPESQLPEDERKCLTSHCYCYLHHNSVCLFLSVRLSVQNVKLIYYAYDYIPCDCGLIFLLLFIYSYQSLFRFSSFVTFSSFHSFYNIFLLLLILPSSLIFPSPLKSFFATYNCLPPPTFPSLIFPLTTYIPHLCSLTTYISFTFFSLLTFS